MKHILSGLAFSGLVALGLAAAAPSAEASALSAGGMAVNAVKTVETASDGKVIKADHRRRHYRSRRHHRPRSGIYFEFGTGGFRYGPPPYYARPPYYTRPPYYARPRYVRPPVYARPRYVRPRPAYGLSSAHVNWCYSRYRSYREWDNSFQPYNGPRRACLSPYMR